MPLGRAFRNFFVTGNAWGMFSKRSHFRNDGTSKVRYNTLLSATKSAEAMGKKNPGLHFSVYKCVFCDGYHLGKNRQNKKPEE